MPRKPIRDFTPSKGEGEAKITFMFTHKHHRYSTLRHTGEEVKRKKEKQLTRARENRGAFRLTCEVFSRKVPTLFLPLPTLCIPSPEGANRPERNMARLRFYSANAPSA